MLSYWTPSVLTLRGNFPIYNSLSYYTHYNFILLILEDLGPTGSVSKEYMLSREQIYLNLLFSNFSYKKLNNSPTAATTLGFKHRPEFGINRSLRPQPASAGKGGLLNPMAGSTKRIFP